MAAEYLIGSTSEFRFDPEALVRAAVDRWPGADVQTADGRLGELVAAFVHLPGGNGRGTEVSFHRGGDGIGLESPDDNQVAEFVAWLARAAPVPDDGTVVLVNWSDDLVPITTATSAPALLAGRRG